MTDLDSMPISLIDIGTIMLRLSVSVLLILDTRMSLRLSLGCNLLLRKILLATAISQRMFTLNMKIHSKISTISRRCSVIIMSNLRIKVFMLTTMTF